MDKKVQKMKVLYAKYPTNGFILDYFVKSLEIEQKDDDFRKIYQRFVKEEDISTYEYHDTLNTIVGDIVYKLSSDIDDREPFEDIIKEFFIYFNRVKTTNETLKCSQKQLDFIQVMDIFIPIIAFLPTDEKLNIFRELIPTYRNNSFLKLFEIVEYDLKSKEKNIRELLFDILDSKKHIGYDSINKNLDNWFNYQITPSMLHIEYISKLAQYTKSFTDKTLLTSLKYSKIIQYLYDKSVNYFGDELTDLLIEHYKFLSQKPQQAEDKFLKRYNYIYRDLNSKLYKNILKSALTDNVVNTNQIEIIKENRKHQNILYKIDEKTFFKNIDMLLPIKYFNSEIDTLYFSNLHETNSKYNSLLGSLYANTWVNQEKSKESEEEFLADLKKYTTLYNTEEDPYFAYVNARYYAQKREYKKATNFYLKALKYGKNCMGESLKLLLQEGLIVSAQDTRKNQVDLINAKSDFTKFYNEAYRYNLIQDLPREININFLSDMKKQFDIHFKNLFPDVKQAKNNFISPNFGFYDMDNIKIDYTKPDKLIRKGLPSPITQLMYCASRGNYKSVKKLIDSGADVNLLKASDNASALLMVLPVDNIPIVADSLKVIRLLISRMSLHALNTKLVKRKDTALSRAIELGLVAIVKLLLQKGIDVENKCKIDDFTPLYFVITLIGLSRRDEIYQTNSKFNIEHPLDSKQCVSQLAKANIFSNAILDEDRESDLVNIMNNPKIKEFIKKTETMQIKELKRNRENYYKIFDLILEAIPKVDVANKHNFTPLILATELNENELVEKLLAKGANVDWYNDKGFRAYDYAYVNHNTKLMELLA